MKTPVLVIAGPTASGKTRLAVEIARRHRGEVISADSMQIYRGMDIGTAKPTMEERRGVPHHLLDIVDPAEPFSVADYVALAHRTAAEIAARGNLPILCGGTGLYIDSFIGNLTFFPETGGGAARAALQERYRREGGEALHRALRAVDPETAEKVHPNNAVRLVRALEVFEETGVPLSEWGRRARQTPSPYAPLFLGLRFADRAALYARIDARVDAMMAAGLETEARRLRERGAGATAAAAIGYKELFDFFDGECTREEAVERIQLHSRRYAKRQMTWFRRNDAIHWLEASRPGEEILHEAEKLMEISGM